MPEDEFRRIMGEIERQKRKTPKCDSDERMEIVMSTARHPVRPGGPPSDDDTVKTLREYLDDVEAETLARRIRTADEDEKHAVDWQTVKRRILEQKPRR